MKVNDPNTTGVSQEGIGGAGLQRAQQAERTGRQQVAGRSGGGGLSPDSVALSGLGSHIRTLSADSPERAAQLDKLGNDVQAGRYRVDAQQLSQHLIEDALKPRL